MKLLLYIAILPALLLCINCSSRKIDPETLPKDVALKPAKPGKGEDAEILRLKLANIEKLIATTACTDASAWKIAPLGAKACGGPATYIAYPKLSEANILPLIEEFTELQDAYNRKYGILSDCTFVEPPAGVRCENDKAVLMSPRAE